MAACTEKQCQVQPQDELDHEMLRKLTVGLLSDRDERFGSGVDVFWEESHVDELDVVVKPDDPAVREDLDVFLRDVAGLVVEKAVGVSAPGDAAHVNSTAVKGCRYLLELGFLLGLGKIAAAGGLRRVL